MAVSKRLRFEILRRDGHRCKYCGLTADEVKLTVDHVTPTALGGTDAPENLAAACPDCNNGKTSVPADAAVVADVEQKVVAWAVARKRVAAEMEQEFTDQTAAAKRIRGVFAKACKEEHGAEPKIPADWSSSIGRWLQLGISEARAKELAAYAACRHNVPLPTKWKYLAASCWAVIRELEDRTAKAAGAAQTPVATEQEMGDDDVMVEAAAAIWALEWLQNCDELPSPEDASTFRASVQDAIENSIDNGLILAGAKHAIYAEDSTSITSGIADAQLNESCEHVIEWSDAWYDAVGWVPGGDVYVVVQKACERLRSAGAPAEAIRVAAVFAGAHLSTDLHFHIREHWLEAVNVRPQRATTVDIWAKSYSLAHGWPSDEVRAGFHAELDQFKGPNVDPLWLGDIYRAAAIAGLYGDVRLDFGMTRKQSVFEAAARLPWAMSAGA